MPAIKITVGAAVAANTGDMFKPLVESAKKARTQIESELGKAGKGVSKGIAGGRSDAERDIAAIGKAADDAAKKAQSSWERSIKAIGSNAMQNLRGAFGFAAGVAGGIARGAGIRFDIGSNVGAAVQAQRQSVLLANKGFLEGAEGAAGKRQNPADLLKEAGVAADKTAHSISDMLDAMTGFTENSGDLALARDTIGEIGKISNATGADLRVMGEAAGRIDLKLQDSVKSAEERKKIILDTMRVFAAEGKTGAIDIEQLAPQIPKLIAGAGRLGMGRTEAFQTAGIIAQISAASGGSASPAKAAQTLTSLLQDIGKSQTGFLGGKTGAKSGIQIPVFTDKSHTKIRDPLELISEAVVASKGDQTKLAQLIPNARAGALGIGLSSIYTSAGGGKAGEDAIRATVAKYKAAVMSQEEVERENGEIMKTTAAKAQVFQNNLERAAASMAERVLPAFEKMAPQLEAAARGFASLVGWASENPGKMITMAIVGSIAKAAIGESIATTLSGLLRLSGGPGATGSAVGAMSKVGTGLTIAATAIVIEQVGEMIINRAMSMKDKEDDIRRDKDVGAENLTRAARMGLATKEDVESMRSAAANYEQRIKAAEGTSTAEAMLNAATFGLSGGEKTQTAWGDKEHIEELRAQLAELNKAMAGIKNGTLKVHVTNQPGPAVDGTATSRTPLP